MAEINEKENNRSMRSGIMTTTNLPKIKDISKRMVEMKITKTNYWPEIAQHPFTSSGLFFWKSENGEHQFGILDEGTDEAN